MENVVKMTKLLLSTIIGVSFWLLASGEISMASYQPTIRPSFSILRDAIIQVESNGRRLARGRAGERGLMQVSRRTWNWTCRTILKKRIPWDWAYNSRYNIEVGAAYLRYCIKRTGNIEDGIRAYNQGIRGSKLGRGHNYLRKVKKHL